MYIWWRGPMLQACSSPTVAGPGSFIDIGGKSVPHATFMARVPGMGWLLSPPKMTPKESKSLGTRPVETSLCLASSGASQGENTSDGPVGATTTLVWLSLLDCQFSLPLS